MAGEQAVLDRQAKGERHREALASARVERGRIHGTSGCVSTGQPTRQPTWRTYLADFDTRRHDDQALLRLSPGGMRLLPLLLEPAVARAARATAVPDREGWMRVTVPIESHDRAVHELLRLGPDVEVLGPDALRARIIDSLGAAFDRYTSDRKTAITPRTSTS